MSILAGCGPLKVPVTGQIGKEPAQGQATARLNGDGTFWVSTLDGLHCEGTYNSLDTDPTLQIPVSCNDGRTGTLLVTRSMGGLSGTATGRLTDGTRGRFVFGKLTFSQAFGDTASSTH